MANETETNVTETKESRAESIRRFKEKNPDKVQNLKASTEADSVKATQPVQPERVVEPIRLKVEHSRMSDIDAYVTVMTFGQIRDYGEFAEELYDDDANVTDKWQRGLENKRVKDAANYLTNPVHFFPPVIMIPVDAESCVFQDGHVTVKQHGIAALDGQHRTASIIAALEKDASIASESIPVVILNLFDLDKRQQIFADINRTPKKVSKALNLVFDHSDRVAAMAMRIAKRTVTTEKDGEVYKNPVMESLIDFERLAPLRKSHNIMSLTNLYNLIKPVTEVVDDANGYVFDENQIANIVDAIVDNLPHVNAVRQGRWTFDTVKAEYVCYSSTLMQAIGRVVKEMATQKDAEGNLRYSPDTMAEAVRGFIQRITEAGGWAINGQRWNDSARRVVADGKIGTQQDHVRNAQMVLRDFLNL